MVQRPFRVELPGGVGTGEGGAAPMRRKRGNMLLEAAMWIPVMVLLIVGMVQIGKITYLYYSLKKTVYSAARFLAVQQGVNFCDLASDPNVTAALQFAITGTT